MPRPIRATAKEIQRSRQDWYIYHLNYRQIAQALPADIVRAYIQATDAVAPPKMTIFGGLPGDYPDRSAYELAARLRLDVNLINPWYLTAEGWADFQALWTQLPEPVDLYTAPCVQVGELYTLSTMPAEASPRK